jgi:DNA ligase-1
VLLQALVRASTEVAATRRRKQKTEILAACIRGLGPDGIGPGIHFLAGRLRQGRIGLGHATLASTGGVAPAERPTLTIRDVDQTLERIARAGGSGSAAARLEAFAALLARATASEQDFLRRLAVGELRQGALESLVLEGIAAAAGVSPALVRRAWMLSADPAAVAGAALFQGEAGLRALDVSVFRPIEPMLAQSAEDLDDVFQRLPTLAIELKLDGARVQVHKSGTDVRVYSRRLNDVTQAVPEIVAVVRDLPARELILDGETIALRSDGSPYPFQITMGRFGRKLEVEEARAALPLTTFYFDCLYVDGRTLIDEPAERRFEALAALLDPRHLIPRRITERIAEAEQFLQDAFAAGHEGAMAKSLASRYEAGNRGAGWLKLKRAHTLDLVVLAAEWGSGRRRGWLSNLHLGARDPATGSFVMLGKTFKGMTDEMLAWQTRRLLELEVSRDGHIVHVVPGLVVEVAFNEVQASPQYPGGVALRFARVKCYRPDKGPRDVTTLPTILALHARTARREPA